MRTEFDIIKQVHFFNKGDLFVTQTSKFQKKIPAVTSNMTVMA